MSSRRKILVNPRLQGKIIAVFIGTALVCFAVQMTLQVIALSSAATEMSRNPSGATQQLVDTLLASSSVGILLLIPLSVFAGLLVTFRIAGPLYRIETYLEAHVQGKEQGELRVRDGDECQNIASLINQALNLSAKSAPAESPSVEASRSESEETVPGTKSEATENEVTESAEIEHEETEIEKTVS